MSQNWSNNDDAKLSDESSDIDINAIINKYTNTNNINTTNNNDNDTNLKTNQSNSKNVSESKQNISDIKTDDNKITNNNNSETQTQSLLFINFTKNGLLTPSNSDKSTNLIINKPTRINEYSNQYLSCNSIIINNNSCLTPFMEWSWNDINNKPQNQSGIIYIRSQKDIIIKKGGRILCNAMGYGMGESGLFFGHGSGDKLKHYDLFGGASYGEEGRNLRDPSIPPIYNIKCGDLYGDDKLTQLNFGSGNKFGKGGGIVVLYSIYGSIIIEGSIDCNGEDGCSGGSILLCASIIHIKKGGKISALGGNKTSYAGKGGDGIIGIYTNKLINDNDNNNINNNNENKDDINDDENIDDDDDQNSEYSDDYDKISNIFPVPYISVFAKGRKICNRKKFKKSTGGININDYKGQWKKSYQRTELRYDDEKQITEDEYIEQRKLKKNVNNMIKWIINKEDKINPNEIESIFDFFSN